MCNTNGKCKHLQIINGVAICKAGRNIVTVTVKGKLIVHPELTSHTMYKCSLKEV